MKNRKWICFVLYFLFTSMVFIMGAAQAEPPKEVREVAESELFSMLDSIPEGYEAEYGFSNWKEFLAASIGFPYQMCTIHPDIMRSNATITDEMITFLDEWRFPVIVHGQMRALLTVAKLKGRWKAVDIGAAAMASRLDAFENSLSLKSSDRDRFILRFYQISADYIVIPEHSSGLTEGFFFSIHRAERGGGNFLTPQFKTQQFTPSSFQDVLPGLRDRYKNAQGRY